MTEPSSTSSSHQVDGPVIAIGIGLIAIGILIFWQATSLRASFGNDAIGPQMMPYVMSVLLVIFGGLTCWDGWRGQAPERDADDFGPVLWIAGGLAVMIALIKTAGFIPATAMLFAATARGFGSRRSVIDLALGFAVAGTCYLFFVKVLGLSLPSGFFETFL